MAKVSTLNVLLHGGDIGTLTLLPGEQTNFAFDDTYVRDRTRLTLSLSFKDSTGELITELPRTHVRVPPFFANMLPEEHLRQYLAKRAGVNPKREFFLLWVLGRDLPGALTIEPADGETWPPVEDIKSEERESKRQNAFRFSLAGVQLKFSAVMESSGGLTIPAQGVGGSWIVKLPSARLAGVPENEHAMMSLARQIGIDVPETQLVPLDAIDGLPSGLGELHGTHALAVKRFDRTPEGHAVHIEDFAQVFGVYPEAKYDKASYRNIAEVLWAEIGEVAIAEFVRRLTFNALIGNADMHLKNWSLIYPDGHTPALAPGYDFVPTIAYIPDDAMALRLGKTKRFEDFSADQLSYFAAKARLPETLVLKTAKETTDAFLTIWHEQSALLGLTDKVVQALEKHIKRIPLTKR